MEDGGETMPYRDGSPIDSKTKVRFFPAFFAIVMAVSATA